MDLSDEIRKRIEEHRQASERGDAVETEHEIYSEGAILDYPQSGERFRGRRRIKTQRTAHPAKRHFSVLRISGDSRTWVSECIISYDGQPTYSVSIMEFEDGLVVHENQYFADPFQPPAWRAALSEPIPTGEQ